MPTVTAALEYLLDMTAEHLAFYQDRVIARRSTPLDEIGESTENDLFIEGSSQYVPAATSSAASEEGLSNFEEGPESTERGSSAPTSIDETPPPSYSTLPVVDLIPIQPAILSGHAPRIRAPRRSASAMDAADEADGDDTRGDTLRRSVRRRRNNH
jgi:hypothetical protein